MPLIDLQNACLMLAHDLATDRESEQLVAGPFVSVPPQDVQAWPRIMYVGQATRNEFYLRCFLNDPTLAGRQQTITHHLIEVAPHDRWAFWRFARRLAALHTADIFQNYSNLIWSNVIRINQRRGPVGWLEWPQQHLLAPTLAAEAHEYKPDVCVFVNGDYGKQYVREAFPNGWSNEPLIQGRVRLAQDGLPPMIWFRHPNRLSNVILDQWTTRVAELVGV